MSSSPAQQGRTAGSSAPPQPKNNSSQTQSARQPIAPTSVPAGNKETEPGTIRQSTQAEVEKIEAQEVKAPEKVPEEVAGWVERVERGEDVQLAQPVTHRGQTLVEPAKPKEVKVVLPLTDEDTQRGLKLKVVDSLRWLAEWCVRLVKKFPGKVLYRSSMGS